MGFALGIDSERCSMGGKSPVSASEDLANASLLGTHELALVAAVDGARVIHEPGMPPQRREAGPT